MVANKKLRNSGKHRKVEQDEEVIFAISKDSNHINCQDLITRKKKLVTAKD